MSQTAPAPATDRPPADGPPDQGSAGAAQGASPGAGPSPDAPLAPAGPAPAIGAAATYGPPAPAAPVGASDSAPALTEAAPAEAAAPVGHAPATVPTALDVPRDTTPTFELEMLVSGAILVGLFQLPPVLDGAIARYTPHYGLVGVFLGEGVGLLAMAAIYGLIGCFIVHLALRGYWVACVGVQSVFPRGVRWERMQQSGPIGRALLRERMAPLDGTIARLDNAASLVFAAGFLLASSTIASALGLGLFFLFIVVARAYGVLPSPAASGLLCVALMLPIFAASAIDYKFGDRLQGRTRSWVRRLIRVQLAIMPRSAMTLQSTIGTNVDKRVATAFFVGGFALAMGAVFVPRLIDADVPGASHYPFFADETPTRAVHAHYYDDLRGAEASPRDPSIESAVVTGPYVRLFVPYVILRHDDAIRRDCPGVRPLAEVDDAAGTPAGDAAADAVLRCALRLHRPALDGRPLDALGFRFFADPRSNRRGFVMFVPTAGLAPGEHRLTVWPARANGRPAPRHPHTIPFWR